MAVFTLSAPVSMKDVKATCDAAEVAARTVFQIIPVGSGKYIVVSKA